MAINKLPVSILWHQHQPFYQSGDQFYQMPWVRFHGTKDYLDMLLVLEEFPKIKQNVNLVPSLIAQIEDYAHNGARDNIWELTEKSAAELQDEDKKKILTHFFLANEKTMIRPFPRYLEMYIKYKEYLKNETLERQIHSFSEDEYRDLQVWYNLSWIGVESRKRENIAKLFKKGKGFSEADKTILFEETRNILKDIVPYHKKLWDSGQLDVSTTPFYHPILPLLCDNYIAQQSSPGISLPRIHFAHPEDAETQVRNAIIYFEKIFGRKPRGMWPSEGSVSVQALEIISRQGLDWVATDEGILANTLGSNYSHSKIYCPYQLDSGRNQINIFFRDHYLSDAIGFVYSNWSAEKAVNDFMNRLHAIRNIIIQAHGEQDLRRFVIPIILDGENCWEYYENDGKTFLRKLYQALSDDDLVETATLSEIIDRQTQPAKLQSIHPGSWINSNYNIWIGAEEDNKSWDILAQTRDFLLAQEKTGHHQPDVIKRAWEKIYIAEGSDWNWWYGDDHSSANDMEFDQLYRDHLMDVYRLLGKDVPTILYQTIKAVHFDRFVLNRPKNFISPVIDGKATHFYEWVGAAMYEISKSPQSSMHQVTRLFDKLFVGFDAQHFYMRLDFLKKPEMLTEFIISVKQPRLFTIVISPLRGLIEKFEMQDEMQVKKVLKPNFKLGKVFEVGMSFEDLGVSPGDRFGFQISAKLHGQPLEEFPRINLVEVDVPNQNFELLEWSV